MGKKARRPGIDSDRILSKLRRAQEDQLYVRIRRWFPDAGAIEGFVVGIDKRWVAVALLSEGKEHDGYDLIRLKDVHKVRVQTDPDSIYARVLRARGQWPVPAPPVRLDGIKGLVRDVGMDGDLFSVHVERHRPNAMWVGALHDLVDGELYLDTLSSLAHWDQEPPFVFGLRDITRVTISDSYLAGLALVAPPRAAHG